MGRAVCSVYGLDVRQCGTCTLTEALEYGSKLHIFFPGGAYLMTLAEKREQRVSMCVA